MDSPEEAKRLLSKSRLSAADTREILRYLVHRDEKMREGFRKVEALLIAMLTTQFAVLMLLQKFSLPPDSDAQRQLQAATDSLQEARDLIMDDSAIH